MASTYISLVLKQLSAVDLGATSDNTTGSNTTSSNQYFLVSTVYSCLFVWAANIVDSASAQPHYSSSLWASDRLDQNRTLFIVPPHLCLYSLAECHGLHRNRHYGSLLSYLRRHSNRILHSLARFQLDCIDCGRDDGNQQM